jgi:hypothetical protein
METHLTHWKKNNDSRYISGEDLKSSLNGLRPEMVVTITKFQDSETYDQTSQAKVMKTGFYLKELDGKDLYKPVILNNTNAVFCLKEFNSEFMENWLNKPLVLYAKPDSRHGHVVRFKKYYAPPTITDKNGLAVLSQSTTLKELATNWNKLTKEEKNLPTVLAKKETLKTTLK